MTSPSADPYRERFTAPLSWWIGALAFGLTCAWLLYVASNALISGLVGGTSTIVAAVLVWAYGNVVVEADTRGLRVGRAYVEADHIGEIETVTGEQWHFLMGPGANHKALYVARPWLRSGVKVAITDPSDPAPYWLVASRNPSALAAAIGHTGTSNTPSPEGEEPRGQVR